MLKESHRFGIQVPYCPFDPLSHAPAASSLGSVGAVNKLSPTAIVHPSVLGPPGTSRFATTTARFLFNATQLTHPALTLTGDAVVVGLGVGHESFWVVEDGYGFAFAFAICEGLVDGSAKAEREGIIVARVAFLAGLLLEIRVLAASLAIAHLRCKGRGQFILRILRGHGCLRVLHSPGLSRRGAVDGVHPLPDWPWVPRRRAAPRHLSLYACCCPFPENSSSVAAVGLCTGE